jgi:FkbH-like protein
VTCVLVPEELAYLPALFADTDLFDAAALTDEDRRRTEMIEADAIRQQAQERMSEEEFRRSLNLQIDVFEAEPQHLARATQLINKTNQFNLTTIRRTHDEVAALAAGRDTRLLCLNISDKYGDYGLVGVSILRKENTICIIDTLLMSCRVLGRGAEEAFVARLAETAQALGCNELRGKYIPTPKNALVADLYERLHFTYDPQADDWYLALARTHEAECTDRERCEVSGAA